MISLVSEIWNNPVFTTLFVLVLLWNGLCRTKVNVIRVVIFVVGVLVTVFVLHPGTKKNYFYYVPGVIAKYREITAPHRPVVWARYETPISSTQKQDLPNIIIILADDLGYNDLSGGAGVATPHIDALRDSGVRFTQAYSGHATCSPARASLLTGRFPSRFGYEYTSVHWLFAWALAQPSKEFARQPIFHYDLLRTVPDESQMRCPPTEVMIPEALKSSNYSTVYIGKWHLGERKEVLPENRGFDETLTFLRGASMYYPVNHPDVVNAPLPDAMDEFLFDNLGGNVRHNGTARFPPNSYITDYFGIQAASAIETKFRKPDHPDKSVPPVFMMVAFNAPHTPLQAKKEDYESPDLQHITSHKDRVYAAMIKALDRAVGRITEAVQNSGQADNTIIIFTSDNGGPGYVGIKDMNKPLRGWKATFFEGGFRVPLYMSWPRMIPAGISYDRPVSHVDLFPTSATAGGIDMQKMSQTRKYDGVDLLPFIIASQGSLRSEECSDSDEQTTSKCDAVNNNLADPHEHLYWRTGTYLALRRGDLKIQVSEHPDRVWLSDLPIDLSERRNLVPGLTWSLLRSALNATDSSSSCVSFIINKLDPNIDYSLLSTINSSGYLLNACQLSRLMLDVDSEQQVPLWPGLVEVPIPIDNPTFNVMHDDEEYVYWTN